MPLSYERQVFLSNQIIKDLKEQLITYISEYKKSQKYLPTKAHAFIQTDNSMNTQQIMQGI